MSDKGINQKKLGEILGMSQPNVNHALNPKEKKCFTLEQVARISRYFHVSIDELVFGHKPRDITVGPRATAAFLAKLIEKDDITIFKHALNALAKEMGASTAFSASECADALNYLALAGYSAQEMTDTLPIVLNLAAAGGIDLASASDMVTDAMSALGMETSDFVKNNWQALLLFIVNPFAGAFKLLYDNCEGFRNFINNLLEAIKTGLANAWEAIKSGVETAWNAIGEFFTTILTAIKTTFTTIWESIKTAVTTVMNTIKSTISNLWNGIKTTITNIVNGIKTTVSSVFNNILSGIKTTVGNIANAIKNGFQTAIDFITSLPSKALQWGKDMIMGIVNGIKSCISAVGDAVKSVADKISSFLHFSVPDEGPLTDYEKWMPDFMKGLASGIEKSKALVAKAVDGVASDMVLSPNVNLATIDNVSSPNGSTQTDLVCFTSGGI